jgi:ABC-type transport system substrate-binding protein
MKKVLYCLSLLMLTLFAWSLQSPVASAEKKASVPKYGGVMSFNHTGGTNVISAPADTFMLLQRIGRAVFEPLFITDIKERIKPWLAESYEMQERY